MAVRCFCMISSAVCALADANAARQTIIAIMDFLMCFIFSFLKVYFLVSDGLKIDSSMGLFTSTVLIVMGAPSASIDRGKYIPSDNFLKLPNVVTLSSSLPFAFVFSVARIQ